MTEKYEMRNLSPLIVYSLFITQENVYIMVQMLQSPFLRETLPLEYERLHFLCSKKSQSNFKEKIEKMERRRL